MEIKGLETEILKNKFSVSRKIFDLEGGKIKERSVYVISAKVVSIAEGNYPQEKGFEKLVKKEGFTLSDEEPFLTIRDKVFLPNSGVDRSNALKAFSILPKNPKKSAKRICENLKKISGLKKIGIIISDSTVFPLRRGVSSVALGAYGFRAVEDLRGKEDVFGKKMKFSLRNLADMLSAAAALEMGETNERVPFVRITGASLDFDFTEKDLELEVDFKDCLFASLYSM